MEKSSQPQFRGFHYDIARGSHLSPAVFLTAITTAARAGYTHFLPYLENMIRLPALEKACPVAAYTAADWQRFQQTAREHHIELVPHFNVIGHAELIVPAYPELGGEAAPGWHDLDPERPATRDWTLRCLGEFCDISESEYFLIGGDEWQPPRHLLERPDFDVARAWVNQINLAVEFLVARGRRPIVWHDMLLHYPTALRDLSRHAVIAFWFYDEDSDYPILEFFQRHGFAVFMATGLVANPCRLMQRGVNALRCAARAAQRHHAQGLIVTTWNDCRWENQAFNIPASASVLRGAPAPDIVTATTLAALRGRLPVEERLAAELARPIWKRHEDLRELIRAEQPRIPKPPAPVVRHPIADHGFGLDTTNDRLRFRNDNETFEVLPAFGASLQSWLVGGWEIIPAGNLTQTLPPGGYRSFAAVGGFRPIWALGAHSNPCILWQYPYDWRIIEQTGERIVVELFRDFPHVGIRLRISITRGEPGFTYEARATNRLEHAWGAFNFNLPLAITSADVTGLKFQWEDAGRERETSLTEECQTAFAVPARGPLTVAGTAWTLHIEAAPEQTALYFVDWSPAFITPDLRGVYRPRAVNEETVTRWRFTCQPTTERNHRC